MTKWKQCFLDTREQLHAHTHNDCDSKHNICSKSTHNDYDNISKFCSKSRQNPSVKISMKSHQCLTEELLTFDSSWEVGTLFSLRVWPLLVYGQECMTYVQESHMLVKALGSLQVLPHIW